MSSGDKVRFLRPQSPSILGQGARPPAGPAGAPVLLLELRMEGDAPPAEAMACGQVR
jgi:hypothetical protein